MSVAAHKRGFYFGERQRPSRSRSTGRSRTPCKPKQQLFWLLCSIAPIDRPMEPRLLHQRGDHTLTFAVPIEILISVDWSIRTSIFSTQHTLRRVSPFIFFLRRPDTNREPSAASCLCGLHVYTVSERQFVVTRCQRRVAPNGELKKRLTQARMICYFLLQNFLCWRGGKKFIRFQAKPRLCRYAWLRATLARRAISYSDNTVSSSSSSSSSRSLFLLMDFFSSTAKGVDL